MQNTTLDSHGLSDHRQVLDRTNQGRGRKLNHYRDNEQSNNWHSESKENFYSNHDGSSQRGGRGKRANQGNSEWGQSDQNGVHGYTQHGRHERGQKSRRNQDTGVNQWGSSNDASKNGQHINQGHEESDQMWETDQFTNGRPRRGDNTQNFLKDLSERSMKLEEDRLKFKSNKDKKGEVDEFTVKQISQDEFIISGKEPKHAQKHVFFEDMIDGEDSKEEWVSPDHTSKKQEESTYEKQFCEVQVLDENQVQSKISSPDKDSPDYKKQTCLEDFGYGQTQMTEENQDCFGAGAFGNSLDHSDLRFVMKQAMDQYDEEGLAMAIDKAKDLGQQFEWKDELEKAEDAFYDMTQCPSTDFIKNADNLDPLN